MEPIDELYEILEQEENLNKRKKEFMDNDIKKLINELRNLYKEKIIDKNIDIGKINFPYSFVKHLYYCKNAECKDITEFYVYCEYHNHYYIEYVHFPTYLLNKNSNDYKQFIKYFDSLELFLLRLKQERKE